MQAAPDSAAASLGRGYSSALVVLVHGMGRTSLSMLPMQRALERSGYRVLNFHYSSYGPSIAGIGTALAHRLDAELSRQPASRVHFVGHSLGNIILRWLLVHRPPPAEPGRFAMLAPPRNAGTRKRPLLFAPRQLRQACNSSGTATLGCVL